MEVSPEGLERELGFGAVRAEGERPGAGSEPRTLEGESEFRCEACRRLEREPGLMRVSPNGIKVRVQG